MTALAWKTSKRTFDLAKRPLVMAILNVTPDSFSDGGRFLDADDALRQAEQMIEDGADIIDSGGESTRPGSSRVSAAEEAERVIPIVQAIASRFDVAVSVDTTKLEVAAAAVDAGGEIINDISGLRFEPRLADLAAASGAGLVLMHSRGEFEQMHSQPPVEDIFDEVVSDFQRSTSLALDAGVAPENIALDIGIGFGKTFEQNLQLIAGLGPVIDRFPPFPILVGTSRKSFIGKILNGAPADKRLSGSLATAVISVWNGAKIVRVHDVKATVEALKVVNELSERC